tara:strand:+ start:291 stop:533 length:243 start_codon:yes stop_codon:yes gene_type:complete
MIHDMVQIWRNIYYDNSEDICEYNNTTHEYHLTLFIGDQEYECTWPRRDVETLYAIGPKDEQMAMHMLARMRQRVQENEE